MIISSNGVSEEIKPIAEEIVPDLESYESQNLKLMWGGGIA